MRRKQSLKIVLILFLMSILTSCSESINTNSAPAKQKSERKLDKPFSTTQPKVADMEDRAIDYLENQVPEVAEYRKQIEQYNRDNKADVNMIYRTDGIPDPTATDEINRDYYCFYVGEDMGDHTNRWQTFYVNKGLTSILVDDVLTGETITLDEWRKRGY
ncbi:MAG: hypothetical protein ACM3UZ_12550 [Acidobacteriota bacterium]